MGEDECVWSLDVQKSMRPSPQHRFGCLTDIDSADLGRVWGVLYGGHTHVPTSGQCAAQRKGLFTSQGSVEGEDHDTEDNDTLASWRSLSQLPKSIRHPVYDRLTT